MRSKVICLVGLICLAVLLIDANVFAAVTFRPAPYQDTVNGRNSYVYNPAVDHPTSTEKTTFMNDIKDSALIARDQYGVPASAIMGMAAVESGYGFTQIAYYANNLFGLKVWAYNPAGAWQLKGQPDEDSGQVRVITNYGYDRKVFDESYRRDNWYRAFATRKEAIDYLAGTLLLNSRYKPARDNYQYRIKNGWSYQSASKQYCYDIAQAGYNHLGGSYYMNKIGAVMDQLNLYQYDNPTIKPTNPPTTTDNVPWVSPINVTPISSDGLNISGTVTLAVTAGDDKGISKVEFYSADGAYLIATDTTVPYSISWETNPWVANGEQKLKVVAYDTANQSAAATRTVYVCNNVPPTVGTLTVSPVSDNYYVWGDVAISINASDDKGISKVEFYSQNGSYLIATDTTAPYSVNWATNPWVNNGEQVLKAIAYDTDGKTASTTKTVYVANNLPPEISQIEVSPVSTDGYYVWRDVTISVTVTDPNGASDISKVEFYSADGAYLIATKTAAPYSITWVTYPYVPNGTQILRVKAYDKAGHTTEVSRTVNVSNQ